MSVFRYIGHAFQTKIRFFKLKNIRQQFMPWKVVKYLDCEQRISVQIMLFIYKVMSFDPNISWLFIFKDKLIQCHVFSSKYRLKKKTYTCKIWWFHLLTYTVLIKISLSKKKVEVLPNMSHKLYASGFRFFRDIKIHNNTA